MEMGSASSGMAVKKFHVFRSVGEVFAGVTRHYFQLLALAIPSLLSMIVVAVGTMAAIGLWPGFWLGVEVSPDGDDFSGDVTWTTAAIFGAIALVLAAVFVFMSMAVRWHRFVLFGEGEVWKNGTRAFLRREDLRYLIVGFKLLLLVFFVFIPLAFLFQNVGGFNEKLIGTVANGLPFEFDAETQHELAKSVVSFVLLLPISLILARTMLAFPDAAVGRKGSVEASIEATRGNTMRLFAFQFLVQASTWICAAAYSFIFALVTQPLAGNDGSGLELLEGILYLPLLFYFMMLQITMLSVAYREIVGLPGSNEPVSSPPEVPQAAS